MQPMQTVSLLSKVSQAVKLSRLDNFTIFHVVGNRNKICKPVNNHRMQLISIVSAPSMTRVIKK